MTLSIYVLIALGAVFASGFLYVKIQARKIAKQQAEIAAKQAEIERVKQEARTIAEELDNAEKAKKITETHRALSERDIDERMQSKGYFRND